MPGNSIKSALQEMLASGETILQGTVISTAPLKIQAENDPKLIITERISVVPWHLTDYRTSIALDCQTEATSGGSGEASFSSHRHSIRGETSVTVHNALRIGEQVHLLALQNGKLYYVLDRVSGQVGG